MLDFSRIHDEMKQIAALPRKQQVELVYSLKRDVALYTTDRWLDNPGIPNETTRPKMPKLAQLWDLFVQAESASYEKSAWYDIFLSQFLADLYAGKTVEKILTFCNWSGAGTLIGCEFLSDIQQVCSQPGDGDDLGPLRQHLFSKGWKALAVLLTLGQQSLSCSHELANLLISLYPMCLEIDSEASERGQRNKYLRLNNEVIDTCLGKVPLKSKLQMFYRQFSVRGDHCKSHSTINCRSRKNTRGTKDLRRKNGKEETSSESENMSEELDLTNMKSSALKIRLDPMDFDYFTNVIRSDDDNRLDSVIYQPRRRTRHSKIISPSDFTDDFVSDVMKSRVSSYEFSMVLLQLLVSLCRSETGFTISNDNSYPVCSKSVKFALENLCSLQFGSVSPQSLEANEAADLKSNLTLLLVISLDRVLGCPDVTKNVILTGISPMMLRLLEDSVCKLNSDYSDSDYTTEMKELYERDKQLEVIFGLISSSINFLLSLLLQNPNPDHLRNFLELFKLFIESSCGKLIVNTVLVLTRFGNTKRARKVIDLIGQLISGLKRVRKEMVSPHSCKRLRHKKCGSGYEIHHHHDLFGSVFNPVSLVSANCHQNCCVSSLFVVFVRLLKIRDKLSVDVLNRVLKIMNVCGTCCCFTSKTLLQSLTRIIQSHSRKTKLLVYQLLENTIYPEMGYFAPQNHASITCVICFKNSYEDSLDDQRRVVIGEDAFSKKNVSKEGLSDRASSVHSEKSHQSDGSNLDLMTSGRLLLNLDLFRELILSQDFRTVHEVTSHFLKCAPRMCATAKHTILFNIFFPTFLTSKANYLSEKEEVSLYRILSSLSIFSSLLNHTSFAEQFISLKGLHHVLELISMPVFSKHCCSVLEKTIVVSVLTPEADLSSFTVLRDTVDSVNKLFFKLYDSAKSTNAMGAKKKTLNEKIELQSEIKKVDVLHQVCAFWRTYANLSLVNPILRDYFSDVIIVEDCKSLLNISLSALTSATSKSLVKTKVSKYHEYSESYLFTKLIESLVIFILATVKDNDGVSVEKSVIDQLTDALLSNDLKNVDVKRLAEVLLKCSLVQPCPYQSTLSSKVPYFTVCSTLEDECQDVEDFDIQPPSESSSVEDNYVTADEGYEADIEIHESDTSLGDVYESKSTCSFSDKTAVLTSREYFHEKYSAKSSHTVVHPKLCSLAIDLLIQLYQERSVEEDETKTVSARKSKQKDVSDNAKKHRPMVNTENSCSDKGSDRDQSPASGLVKPRKSGGDSKTKNPEDKDLLGFVSIFQRLISLCRDKRQICLSLCGNGVVLKLLNGFRKCLGERNERYSELQRVILDLVTILGSYSISREELSCYLGFFKMNDPPVDHLLNPLTSLLAKCRLQPIYSLNFPVGPTENPIPIASPDIGKTLRTRHWREGVNSSWSCAALTIPIAADINWSVWMQGFSLSLWLKIERSVSKINSQGSRSKSPQKPSRKTSKAESHISFCSTLFSDCGMVSDATNHEGSIRSSPISQRKPFQITPQNHVHIFTLGNEFLALECWSAVDADFLIWRLTRSDSHRGYEVVAENISEHCIPSGSWNFFAINVRDCPQRKKTVIEVTLLVNGWDEVKVLLPFDGLLMRKPRPSAIACGQLSKQVVAAFHLSNIMLFACPVFTKESAVYLFGLGPNCTNLTECQIGRRSPNYTSVFGFRTIGKNVSWEKILEDGGENLRELQNNLLITFSAENPSIANTYPLATNSSSGLLFPGFRPGPSESRGAQKMPTVVSANVYSKMMVQKNQGFIPAVRLLGGSSTFLFLFARVVEISSCPDEQAKALFVLLQLVQSDCEIFSQFISNKHYKLLHKVFQSSKCASGLHFVKAILDACCDEPIVQNSGGNFHVMQHSDAVIVNSFLISTILDSWKSWSCTRQENDILRIFFLSLNTLLKDDHPHRDFNVTQLNRVSMVDRLLSFCKERLLYEDVRNLQEEIFYSLIELVRSLMGAPPEFSHIVAVTDCLIMLHPVNATYVTHSKNSFYFLLSAGQNYSSQEPPQEPISLSEPVENNFARQSIASNEVIANVGWSHTGSGLENFHENQARSKERSLQSFTQPVDPTKLNKALKNLQLKQRRKFDLGRLDNVQNDEMDNNRYSDDPTFDSGIAGSYREHIDNVEESDEVVSKAVDESLRSSFPSTSKANPIMLDFISNENKYNAGARDQKGTVPQQDYGAQSIVIEGLLLLLRDTILVLPDNMAYQILNHVVKLEALLVFANHKDHRVRSAVVKVISSYLQRSSDEEINKFIKMKGFHHLANQIALYPASLQLAEDCVHLIVKSNVSLEDEIFFDECDISSFGMACTPPLIALLPRSVHDVSLAGNLLDFLRRFYTKAGNSSRLLLEKGLLEALVKTLVASAHVNSDCWEDIWKDPITSGVLCFFTFIIISAMNSPGVQNLQIITDIKLELLYLYRLEKESCGVAANCCKIIRFVLCNVLKRGLFLLHDKIAYLKVVYKRRSLFLPNVVSSFPLDNSEAEQFGNGLRFYASKPSDLMSSNGNNSKAREIPLSELSDRFKFFVTNSIEFLIYSETIDGKYNLSQAELALIERILPNLLELLSSTLGKRSYGKRTVVGSIYWSIRETIKVQMSELIVWLLSPRQTVKTRMFLVDTLIAEFKTRDLILLLLQTHPQIEQKFSIFFWDLMYNTKLTNADLRKCQELKECLLQWGVVSPQSMGCSHDAWKEDCSVLIGESDKQMASWEKQTETSIIRCVTKYDGLIKSMIEEALAMTGIVVEAQNKERKSVMEKMRSSYSENIQTTTKWNELISQLTHEKAVWFFEKSYPVFWQLDPTEGPLRVRKRLSRCHIGIDGRYLMPSHRHKLDVEGHSEPLSYLFEKHHKNCPAMILTERLHCNEKIRAMSLARVVTPSTEIPGELLIGETCIYFVADDRHKYLNTFGISSTVWPFQDVREIHNRRYQLQERAIEIFLVNGKTYLIAFQTSKERNDVVVELLDCNLPNRLPVDNLNNIMQQWREGLITNWDYLTQLNKLAGRSYNDLMQYPVFPFVLSDYRSASLDLTNKTVFRNFKKPMAVQEKKNEQHYVNIYNELLSGLKQASLNKEPFHYGSHYSNSGTVLHFLVRLPPFTNMLLQYQDRNFDLPDRTFHSMHTTWRLASCDSTTDVKEMLPEFFFLPEFLINAQGFDFGVRQNGEIVDDVELPPWSEGDARKFILIHRQALESDYVTENLPHWIDLVFGYKQTGKAAVEAINVFHPATYCGFDVHSIPDPVERTAWETMVKTYGQTPKQLLKNPHPLVIQSLVEAASDSSTLEVADGVRGLKWGHYVGSPIEPEPSIYWRQQTKEQNSIAGLVALKTGDVLVLPQATTVILEYNKEKGLSAPPTGFRLALISWSHPDNILRAKLKELPPAPIVFTPNLDPISTCQSAPECNQLWIGHVSGNISVYEYYFHAERDSLTFHEISVQLQGHSKAVTKICISRAYSIVATAGGDGTIIIWDLNNTSYIRNIDVKSSQILALAVSDTLGDIACVTQSSEEPNNMLRLYTINATFVTSTWIEETVTAVCFSTAPEGISVNVIACGLSNGSIKLYSTWDLSLVCEINYSNVNHCVTSLTYSHDSHLLYVSYSDASVVVWESSDYRYGGRVPKLINLTGAK